MRPYASTFVAVFAVIAFACGGSSSPGASASCVDFNAGCTCGHSTVVGATTVPTCNDSVLPDTICCADPGWPSSATCTCISGSVRCGVVPGYETGADGGPQDACVCSSDTSSSNQVSGATCYANGTTTPGAGLGTCCMFSAQAPGSLGIPSCECSAGLHTCGAGGVQVDDCSATSFPTGGASCSGDSTQVTSCM